MPKNYTWLKPYHYVYIPIYLIKIWKIRLFKIGQVRRRVGAKVTKPEVWNLYEKLLTK